MPPYVVSGYTESGGGSPLFFVSIVTKSIQKSIKKGFINILSFFMLELLTSISEGSVEYL